jgi:type IV secretory pathway VirB10-like protein
VDYISDHRGEGKKREFLVYWEDFPLGDDNPTWEPLSSVRTTYAYKDYVKTLPAKPAAPAKTAKPKAPPATSEQPTDQVSPLHPL